MVAVIFAAVVAAVVAAVASPAMVAESRRHRQERAVYAELMGARLGQTLQTLAP